MRRINSRDNAQYKALRRLAESSRERKNAGLSLLDGPHLVAAYGAHVGVPEQLVLSASGLDKPEIRALVDRVGGSDLVVLSDALFKDISPVVSPTGVVAVVKTPRSRSLPGRLETCVMLEDVRDPGNLGSILRTAAAAGIKQVFLSASSVHAWSPRVLRAAMGAHFMLQVYEQVDLAAAIDAFPGTPVAASATASRSLFDTDLSGPVALIFGNEGGGLSAALRTKARVEVAIPMPGRTESLNVAAAVAVCLYERVRQIAGKRRESRPEPQ